MRIATQPCCKYSVKRFLAVINSSLLSKSPYIFGFVRVRSEWSTWSTLVHPQYKHRTLLCTLYYTYVVLYFVPVSCAMLWYGRSSSSTIESWLHFVGKRLDRESTIIVATMLGQYNTPCTNTWIKNKPYKHTWVQYGKRVQPSPRYYILNIVPYATFPFRHAESSFKDCHISLSISCVCSLLLSQYIHVYRTSVSWSNFAPEYI